MSTPQTPSTTPRAQSDQVSPALTPSDQAIACAGHPTPRMAPSPWVSRFAPLVAPGGTILDVACGSGRNGLLFADRGHPVVFMDRNTDALRHTLGSERLESAAEVLTLDLEDGSSWPLGERRFAAVIVCNYLYRPHMAALFDAVAPGGVLLYETFAMGNERHGRPRNPDHLLKTGELLTWVPPSMQVVAFEQGEEQRCSALRVVQRLCAVKTPYPVQLIAS